MLVQTIDLVKNIFPEVLEPGNNAKNVAWLTKKYRNLTNMK